MGGTKVQRALVTEVKGRYFAGINRHAEAEALLKNAIELKEQVWGLNTVNVIAPLQILTQIYLRQHRLQDAYNVAARAYNLALQLRAKQPVFFASIEDTLGYVFLEFGQAAKAEALFLDVRAIMARAGDEAAIGLADDHLALTYLYLLQYEKARQFAAESLMILRRRGGPETPQVLGAELNLAVIEVEGGIQLAEAEQALRHVLSIYEVALGREDPDTAKLYNNLGWLEVKRKRPQEAAAWFRQSLGIYAKARRAQTFTLTSQDAPGGVAERETARAIRGFLEAAAQRQRRCAAGKRSIPGRAMGAYFRRRYGAQQDLCAACDGRGSSFGADPRAAGPRSQWRKLDAELMAARTTNSRPKKPGA